MRKRKILITGITKGLGLALLKRFDAMGHEVFGCGRTEDRIQSLRNAFDGSHRFDCVDVADAAAVQAWADDLSASKGAPDLLINNAALMNRSAPLWEITAEEFQELMQVNVEGAVHIVRSFLPAMFEAGQGILVHISSGWGRSTSADVAPYCTSKWAIEGMSQALAQELPNGFASVALNPGIIDTEMLRSCWQDAAGQFPKPEVWAQRAAPFILGISTQENGKALTVA